MLSRADLLLARAHHTNIPLEQLAAGLGFVKKQDKTSNRETEANTEANKSETSVPNMEIQEQPLPESHKIPDQLPDKRPSAPFYRIESCTSNAPTDSKKAANKEQTHEPPDWYVQAQAFNPNEIQSDPSLTPPKLQPLMKSSRLQPLIRKLLGGMTGSQQIDTEKLVEQISKAEQIRHFPRQQHHRWQQHGILILDFAERLTPFWEDFNALVKNVLQQRGKAGLRCLKMDNNPLGSYKPYQQTHKAPQPWQMPAAATPVIICSDLGLHDPSGAVTERWELFGYQLKKAGIRPQVFMPVSADRLSADLAAWYQQISWDYRTTLKQARQPVSIPQQPGKDTQEQTPNDPNPKNTSNNSEIQAAETLLGLLSPASRLEPELIRDARRQLLPGGENPVGMEATLWWHDAIKRSNTVAMLRSDHIPHYRARFKQAKPEQQKQVIQLLKTHHAHLHPSVLHEELIICDSLTDFEIPDIEKSRQFFQNTIKTLNEQAESSMMSWGAGLILRLDQHSYQHAEELGSAWAVVNKKRLQQGKDVELPTGIDQQQLNWLSGEQQQERSYAICQQGNALRIIPADNDKPLSQNMVLLGAIRTDTPWLTIQPEQRSTRLFPLQREIRLSLTGIKHITLQFSLQTLEIATIHKPQWASAIWNDGSLKVHTNAIMPEGITLQWHPPHSRQSQAGYWFSAATQIGRDQFGFYTDLDIKGVIQRMRWIPPGEFIMGSPQDEPQRFDRETQHKVTLTQGYWLAETACTQALWQAIMGENPSRFTESAQNPVERVSWEDITDKFLPRFTELTGVKARLPTEAEWEYACRAGTTTPFNLGENITTDQVNFDGNYPYHQAEKGEYRRKTVPVTTMNAPNAWGLHEMHGNVWEWCQDWFGDYTKEEQVDPSGVQAGSSRVVRGGGWYDGGRDVRSAFRDRYSPDYRYNYIGFRLALGQPELQQARHSRQERSKARQMESERNRSGLAERLRQWFGRK